MKRERIAWSAVVVIALTASWSVPAVARAVADYAKNSDRVDGFHAVKASTGNEGRARKLVATNGRGRLPDHIVRRVKRADNAGAIDHYDSSRLVKTCTPGSVGGYASVTETVGGDWMDVDGIGMTRMSGGHPRPGYPADWCESETPKARRIRTGTYEVNLFEKGYPCAAFPTVPDAATVSVIGVQPAYATYTSNCSEDGIVFTVRIFDPDGSTTDGAFTLSVFESPTILVPTSG